MKKFIFIWMIVGASLQALAQGTIKADSLNHIIANNQNSPENRIIACITLGEFYINKPGNDPKNIDSAAISLKQGQQLSNTLNQHADEGELLFLEALIKKRKGSKDEAYRLNDLALKFLRKKPGSYFLGEALLEKADHLNTDFDDQLKEKTAVLKEATTCFNEKKYAWVKASTWKLLGDMYKLRMRDGGNTGLAIEAYQRSMDTYFSYGYKNVQDIYIEMAVLYKHLGDDQQGLRYCLMAIQTAERAKNIDETLCEIYNYTGMQYLVLLDYANAKKYFVSALDIAEKLDDKQAMYGIAISLNRCYIHNKEYGKMKSLIDRIHAHYPANDIENQYWSDFSYLRYYTEIRNTANGGKYCLLLMNLLGNASAVALRNSGNESYNEIANYYAMAHDFKNAYKYWDKAYSLMLQYEYSLVNKNILVYNHYKIDTASHNLVSALSYLKQYTDLRDSIYTTSKASQQANLQVLYDTQKKEYELAESRKTIHILTQNQQLQQANLEQAILMRNITIAFTILVIIVSTLLYRMVILNRKAIRKIAKTNSLLGKTVSEKEWLLREIHHRVKNNLHTVICLLESQAAYLDKDALKAVDESRHRIYAMSLIHQKLYEHEDVKTVDMNDYVIALVQYIRDSYDLKSDITFHLTIEPILIDTSIAIPVGLIINEVITNAVKYAFVKNGSGEIVIKLEEAGEKIEVIMADNGVGIDMELVNNPTQSMGLRLIKGLCADIGGTIEFSNKQGTEIRLTCNRVLVDNEPVNIKELLNNIPNAD